MKNFSTIDLINYLKGNGFVLRKINDKINCISLENNMLNEELRIEIKNRKTQILDVLDKEKIPLSFMQASIWFVNKLEKSSAAYNVPIAFKILGELNYKVLEKSINYLIARHEDLRTIFPSKDEIPHQVILDKIFFALEQQTIAKIENANHILSKEIAKSFILERGPLFRSKIFTITSTNHLLLFLFHHIIIDAWSAGIFLKELEIIYNSLINQKSVALEPIKIQYADYTLWQHQWLTSNSYQQQLTYWQKYLSSHEDLSLSTDFLRPKTQKFAGKCFYIDFSTISKIQLTQLAQKTGTTMFMFLLTCLNILLHKYSNQETITVGIPCANRTNEILNTTIGFFTNTLPIKNTISEKSTFLQFLTQVKQNCLKLYDHQAVPFENIVNHLNIERNAGKNPVFQVLFDFLDDDINLVPTLGKTQFELLKLENNTSKFDLFFDFHINQEILHCTIEYNTNLYKPATIHKMATHFTKLLENIINNPGINIDRLSLLDEKEKRQILVDWNNTKTEFPNKPIQELFEQQVKKTPHSIAVTHNDRQITYLELNKRANQLANVIQPYILETAYKNSHNIIGVFLEKSVESIIGILAILKANATYLPLSLDYPKTRLSFMIEDAKPRLILTENKLIGKLPSEDNSRVVPTRVVPTRVVPTKICLDNPDFKQQLNNSENINSQQSNFKNQIAYIIYTSGSTGKPKASQLPHTTITNLINWQIRISSKTPKKIAQFANLSFDVSLQEIFYALLNGYELHLVPEKIKKSLKDVVNFVAQQQITTLFLPTSVLNYFAEEALTHNLLLTNLEEIIVAGETLQITENIKTFFYKNPKINLVNQYGPSETHVVTSYKLASDPAEWSTLPPIGKPIANTKIYILDKNLNPVPIGIPGELYVSSDGLAHSYLNRYKLTRERFIAVPTTLCMNCRRYRSQPTCTFYKTGDRARWLPDGNLEFLGRIDEQIKIRGYRIELKEIETILNEHSVIKQSIVMLYEQEHKKFLTGYIVTKNQNQPYEDEIKTYLAQKLPEYMIPTIFIFLDKLPLNKNGKVDKKVLPCPKQKDFSKKYIAPCTELEQNLTQIWSEILKLKQIGIIDNFFTLGGNSLIATQLIAKINNQLKTKLDVTSIFEYPTIAKLGKFVNKNINFNKTEIAIVEDF